MAGGDLRIICGTLYVCMGCGGETEDAGMDGRGKSQICDARPGNAAACQAALQSQPTVSGASRNTKTNFVAVRF